MHVHRESLIDRRTETSGASGKTNNVAESESGPTLLDLSRRSLACLRRRKILTHSGEARTMHDGTFCEIWALLIQRKSCISRLTVLAWHPALLLGLETPLVTVIIFSLACLCRTNPVQRIVRRCSSPVRHMNLLSRGSQLDALLHLLKKQELTRAPWNPVPNRLSLDAKHHFAIQDLQVSWSLFGAFLPRTSVSKTPR
jgi:hypothetical protein